MSRWLLQVQQGCAEDLLQRHVAKQSIRPGPRAAANADAPAPVRHPFEAIYGLSSATRCQGRPSTLKLAVALSWGLISRIERKLLHSRYYRDEGCNAVGVVDFILTPIRQTVRGCFSFRPSNRAWPLGRRGRPRTFWRLACRLLAATEARRWRRWQNRRHEAGNRCRRGRHRGWQ